MYVTIIHSEKVVYGLLIGTKIGDL